LEILTLDVGVGTWARQSWSEIKDGKHAATSCLRTRRSLSEIHDRIHSSTQCQLQLQLTMVQCKRKKEYNGKILC